jgi:hypothetical protein
VISANGVIGANGVISCDSGAWMCIRFYD